MCAMPVALACSDTTCTVPQAMAAQLGSGTGASGSPMLQPHSPKLHKHSQLIHTLLVRVCTACSQPRWVTMARRWHRDTLRPQVPAHSDVMGWLKALCASALGQPII